jgi:hypothetical protein
MCWLWAEAEVVAVISVGVVGLDQWRFFRGTHLKLEYLQSPWELAEPEHQVQEEMEAPALLHRPTGLCNFEHWAEGVEGVQDPDAQEDRLEAQGLKMPR